jgi:hypothetical protein
VRSLTCPPYVKKTFSVGADWCLHHGVHRPVYPSAQKVAAHQHKHPNGIIGVRSGLQKSSPGRRGSDCRPGLGAAGAPEPGQKIERRPCVPVDSSERVSAYPFGRWMRSSEWLELPRRGAALRRQRAGERCRSELGFLAPAFWYGRSYVPSRRVSVCSFRRESASPETVGQRGTFGSTRDRSRRSTR